MKRLKKAILLQIRAFANRWNRNKIYYWAEWELHQLADVTIMPSTYYKWLFGVSMKLAEYKMTQRLADRAIHTIPLNIRFSVA